MADIRQFVKKDGRYTLLERIKKEKTVKEDTTNQKKILPPIGKIIRKGVGIVLLGALFLTGIYFYERRRTYTGYDVLTLTELSESGNMTYMAYGDYILRYSMDGISCLDKNGTLIWGQAYEIKNPIIDICKD